MSNRLPPEVLECIAAHLLALEWLAEAVKGPGAQELLNGNPTMVFEAQMEGVKRYRQMTPEQLRETCDRALNNYRAIAAQLNFEIPDNDGDADPDELPYPEFPNDYL